MPLQNSDCEDEAAGAGMNRALAARRGARATDVVRQALEAAVEHCNDTAAHGEAERKNALTADAVQLVPLRQEWLLTPDQPRSE